jgi:hypothetical protein
MYATTAPAKRELNTMPTMMLKLSEWFDGDGESAGDGDGEANSTTTQTKTKAS